MSDGSFDPYLEWLDIPADRRPPTHYDLLGLNAFESDTELIHTQAGERYAKVHKYQHGARGPYAERLLLELAAARDCLCDPHRKAEYDERLRTQGVVRDGACAGPCCRTSATGNGPICGPTSDTGPRLGIEVIRPTTGWHAAYSGRTAGHGRAFRAPNGAASAGPSHERHGQGSIHAQGSTQRRRRGRAAAATLGRIAARLQTTPAEAEAEIAWPTATQYSLDPCCGFASLLSVSLGILADCQPPGVAHTDPTGRVKFRLG